MNVPLTVAIVLVALAFAASALLVYTAQRRAGQVRDRAYASAVSLSSARIAAFDAKSAESLTLISRGSGQAFEARFASQAQTARSQLAVVNTSGHCAHLSAPHETITVLTPFLAALPFPEAAPPAAPLPA